MPGFHGDMIQSRLKGGAQQEEDGDDYDVYDDHRGDDRRRRGKFDTLTERGQEDMHDVNILMEVDGIKTAVELSGRRNECP